MKSVVILSGGLDSSFNLLKAAAVGEVKLALHFDYGQRAAVNEAAFSRAFCESRGIAFEIVDVRFLGEWSKSSLNKKDQVLPTAKSVNIDSLKASEVTANSVWVVNRNGLFLNIAAAAAEGLGADVVVPGFNLEEAATFPDNSADFLSAVNESFRFSTRGKVRAHAFSISMNKNEILKEYMALGGRLTELWPCYQNLHLWCGECESCLRFKRAVAANGLDFETERAKLN